MRTYACAHKHTHARTHLHPLFDLLCIAYFVAEAPMFEIFLCQLRCTGSNDSDLIFAASSPAPFHLQGVRDRWWFMLVCDKIALRLLISDRMCCHIRRRALACCQQATRPTDTKWDSGYSAVWACGGGGPDVDTRLPPPVNSGII